MVKIKADGIDYIYQCSHRCDVRRIIIHDLAGSLFQWYPSIPIFYWVMAIVMTYILDRKKRKNGDVTITAFMVVRFCKFTLAVVFLWLYAALVRENLRMFGFTLMLFYFIYLGLETYTVYLFEKKRMKREKKENDEQYQK